MTVRFQTPEWIAEERLAAFEWTVKNN